MSHQSRATLSINNHLPATLREADAINILNPEKAPSKDLEIICWLKVIRSIGPDFVQLTGPGLLTSQEFSALADLSRYDDENIRQWLRNDRLQSPLRYPRDSTASSVSASTQSSASSRKFAKSTPRSSAYSSNSTRSSLLRNELYVEEEKQDFSPHINIAEPVRTSETSAISPPADASSASLHLACSTGLHGRAHQTSLRAWKRHEREHVNGYPCLAKGSALREETTSGLRCILCWELEPDEEHFAGHNLTACMCRDEPLIFSRKNLLVSHLENHKVFKPGSVRIADRWSYEIAKSAFSCGFCVGALFAAKEEQIYHIENDHLKKGQSMRDWDYTKMMRSLLRHPLVSSAWNMILDANPTVSEHFLRWPPSVLKDIRLELDLNRETAESFAESAFQHAKMDYVDESQDDMERPLGAPPASALTSMPDHSPIIPEFQKRSVGKPTAGVSASEKLWSALADSRNTRDPVLTGASSSLPPRIDSLKSPQGQPAYMQGYSEHDVSLLQSNNTLQDAPESTRMYQDPTFYHDQPSTGITARRIQQWQQEHIPYSNFATNCDPTSSDHFISSDEGATHGNEYYGTRRSQPAWSSSEYRVTRGPNPTLAPVKRKVSANKEKVEDTHRHPHYDAL